jgi:hypothetical protein
MLISPLKTGKMKDDGGHFMGGQIFLFLYKIYPPKIFFSFGGKKENKKKS